MLHQKNFPSKVADWRSERYDEKNRAIMMRDDNVEVLSIAIDREFHGAQGLLKEHKFGISSVLLFFSFRSTGESWEA